MGLKRNKYIEYESLYIQLAALGFIRNTKIINGFKPNFTRGKDILFIIQQNYRCAKINDIAQAFKGKAGTVYGILTVKSPANAMYDWVAHDPKLKLIALDPLRIATKLPYSHRFTYEPFIFKK